MPGIADRSTLSADLRALGIGRGDVIMLHSSFKALGSVEGGPAAVVEALMDTVGAEGGVIVFASWDRSPYDAFVQGGGLTPGERDAWPAFDPASSGVRPDYAGAIGAALLGVAGARRSANPDRSLAALGSAAIRLIEDHPLDHGFGPGTPLERFVERGGKSLNLGAQLWTLTAIHYAEYRCAVPHKCHVYYEVPLVENGRTVWREVEQMARAGFVAQVQDADEIYIEDVVRGFIGTGSHAEGRVGNTQAYLFHAAPFVDFAVSYMEREFGGAGG